MNTEHTAAEAPAGSVVHLVDRLDAESEAPEILPFGRRIAAPAALMLWILLIVGAVGTGVLLLPLWTGDSPGWWFNLIFTVLPSLFLLGCAGALLETRRASRRERRLSEQWADTRATAGSSGR